ncbi:hypothetical protein [Parasitella parasitica]|uniref:Uncharacterized protein n=1 Tax=Parasitella parasitica TaxID=35722 RepID=A0A0B7NX15_9FUNG|nr:hypothetical protein [Parasitella parasitica]
MNATVNKSSARKWQRAAYSFAKGYEKDYYDDQMVTAKTWQMAAKFFKQNPGATTYFMPPERQFGPTLVVFFSLLRSSFDN